MADTDIRARRPLSPHLQVYRLIPTMVMSIAHRLTGVALYFGMAILVWWIAAIAAGPGHYDLVTTVLGSWFGLLVLFGFTWTLLHHLLGGLRHLVWDTGRWMQRETSTRLAYLTAAGSVLLTLLVWFLALAAG